MLDSGFVAAAHDIAVVGGPTGFARHWRRAPGLGERCLP